MIYLVGAEVILVMLAYGFTRDVKEELRAAQGIVLAVILSSIIWIGGVILWKLLN